MTNEMTNEPGQEVNESGNETNKLISNVEEKLIGDTVSDATATTSDNDTDDGHDDVLEVERDGVSISVTESSEESEIDRPLIVPNTSSASTDDDRSPGLDRDL